MSRAVFKSIIIFSTLIAVRVFADLAEDRKISLIDCNQKFSKNWKTVTQKQESKVIFTTFSQNSTSVSKSLDFKIYTPFEELNLSTVSQAPGGSFSHNIAGFENSIDFAVPVCTPVVAVAPGRVIDVYTDSNSGGLQRSDVEKNNFIRIDHGNGFLSNYVHLCHKCALVKRGELVDQGEVIGLSGATGWAGRPHLHFQMNTFEGNTSVPVEFSDLELKGPLTLGFKVTSKNVHRTQTGNHFNGSESKMSGSHFLANGIETVSPQISWWKGLPTGGEAVHFEGIVTSKYENKFVAVLLRQASDKSHAIAIQVVAVTGKKFSVDLKYSADKIKLDEPVYLVFQGLLNRDDPIAYESHWPIILKD